MDRLKLYQEMLVDAMKRRINATADEENALRNIFDMKIAHIWQKVCNKVYFVEGTPCKVVDITHLNEWGFSKAFKLKIEFCAIPDELRKLYGLTKAEKRIVDAYERNVYSELEKSPEKEVVRDLTNKVWREYHWELYHCKHEIQLLQYMEWKFKLEDVTSSAFVTNGLLYGNRHDSLW